MTKPKESSGPPDLAASRKSWWLLWGGPATSLLVGAVLCPPLRATLWTLSFTLMGVACVVNARRCRRVHCYITGPVFLGAALATVLAASEIVPLGWIVIGAAAAAGALVAHATESLTGRYRSAPR